MTNQQPRQGWTTSVAVRTRLLLPQEARELAPIAAVLRVLLLAHV